MGRHRQRWISIAFRKARLIGQGPDSLGCITCHDLREHKAPAERHGPDLSEMFARLRPRWFQRWIRNPQRVMPDAAMPAVSQGPTVENVDETIDLLWSTLSLGKAMPEPEGLGSKHRFVVQGGREPVVMRTYLPGMPRAIAVGLDNFVSYGFDAQSCRLRQVWLGGFLDITAGRTGRGAESVKLMGKTVFEAPAQVALRVGRPDAAPKVRFRGYEIDPDRHPVFLYEVNGAKVRESVRILNASLGFRSTFEVRSGGRPVWYVREKRDGVTYESNRGTFRGGLLKVEPGDPARFTVTVLRPRAPAQGNAPARVRPGRQPGYRTNRTGLAGLGLRRPAAHGVDRPHAL